MILLSPPPYAAKVEDLTAAREDRQRNDYSYARPYAAYEEVLQQYADWILSIQTHQTIDLHSPILPFTSVCYGQDVIHPNILGHQLMAHTILSHFNSVDFKESDIKFDWVNGTQIGYTSEESKKVEIVKFEAEAPSINHIVLSEDAAYNERILSKQFQCRFINQPAGTYQLIDQNRLLGQIQQEQLKEGVSLSPIVRDLNYSNISFVLKANQLYNLISSKRQIYDYALLQEIGHQRPMNRAGLPLKYAEEKKKSLDALIQEILENQTWEPELINVES